MTLQADMLDRATRTAEALESGLGASSSGADGTQSVGTTAEQLNDGDSLPCTSVTVQADPDNTVNVLVGTTNAPAIKLLPGAGIGFAIDDVSKVWAKAVSDTASVNWSALVPGED